MRYDKHVAGKNILHPASEQDMRLVGAELIRLLTAGDTVLLHGELGAGKTTLVRGAVLELGYTEPVRSPTFNILQSFETSPPVLHADLYRVGSGDGLGIEDYASTHVCFVEWPDLNATWLDPSRTWDVRIEFEDIGRRVTISEPPLR